MSHDLTGAPAPAQPQQPAPGNLPEQRAGLQPRTILLLLSLFVSVLLVAVVAMLPVPYVVLSEGPALNTLSAPGGKPLIEISGRTTYPTSGGLYLTTVSVLGGPRPVTLPTVLRAWLDPDEAAVPVEAVFPPGQTAQQADEETRQEMTDSQTAATAAALQELDIPVTVSVGALVRGVPAARALKVGDVLLAVQGHPVTGYSSLRAAVRGVAPGQVVAVRVRRGGSEQTVDVTTTKDQGGQTALGVVPRYAFPFPVKIQINDIGGPSAGTMFALGIVDKLTPGDLTGGQQIAGTGEISPDGTVSPIGGIAEKMIGARHVGARWFLAPAENCGEVVGHVPAGLRVVRISTLRGAREAVEAIAKGDAAAESLPTCS
ncbi:MAG TPA: S16 family serine protease [Kineosporiaceae bacterium]|nr:S16 family serine protease [Kineosporiaceae bacterium]